MKKMMKNTIFSICLFMVFFFSINQVNANTINNIEIDVYIDSNGNASITETWEAYLNQGTEGYRPYTNLGNSTISNFSVIDETGREYAQLSKWNTSSSFDEKSYKSGINYISNGLELCWGISEYGNKTYTLKYVISNFVTQYTDSQGIYFNFLNLDQTVGNAKITIHSDIPFSLDNSKIWSFGNNGTINFENNSIVLNSNGNLGQSQYMVALIKFESNLFNTNNISNKSFDEIYKSAMSDVSDSPNKKSIFSLILNIIASILTFITNEIVLSVVMLVWVINSVIKMNKRKKYYELDFGKNGRKLPKNNQIDYYREIPCDKNLYQFYWICMQYRIVFQNKLERGIFGAILLKWLKERKITIIKTEKNNYKIDLNNIDSCDDKIENEFLNILKEASGKTKILDSKNFKHWSEENYRKIETWLHNLNQVAQSELEEKGFIDVYQEEIKISRNNTETMDLKKVNTKLKEEAIKIKGFKKFLLDFSMISERKYIDVQLWEEYLIFAHLLGIADKVEEQFSKLSPEFNMQSRLNSDTTVAVRKMTSDGYEGYETGISIASSRSFSSSSGGGSYSSGGSSSGGSSGGGFR